MYLFHQDGVDAFRLEISNCVPLVNPAPRTTGSSLANGSSSANDSSCMDYVGLRARALPFHLPREFGGDNESGN